MLICGAAAHAEGDARAAASFTPPKYQMLRQNEDWSGLAGRSADAPADFWDPIKHVPLSDDGDIWASFGGHVRVRWENWSDFNFGAPPMVNHTDDFLLTRVALHGDLHVGDNLRFFVEGKSALSNDRDLPGGQRTLDVDELALQQLFIDVTIPLGDNASLTLRPGRQMLQFGKQRLISPLPWGNALRAWDGASAVLRIDGWNITGFWTQFVPVQKYNFNNGDAQTEFFGVYAVGKVPGSEVELDLYFLGVDEHDPVTFNGTMGPEDRYTAGGRVSGKFGDSGFDFDLEGAYQFGKVGMGDIRAFMIATQVGYKFINAPLSPRVWAGFDYASGDDSAGGDVETFNHLFPLGHAYFGFMDAIGRQNIVDYSAGITVLPLERMTVALSGHVFHLADTDDALYNAGGAAIRPGGSSNDKNVGAEIDLTVRYQFDRHLWGVVGYSHFFTDDMLEDSGPHDDVDFLYVMAQYTF